MPPKRSENAAAVAREVRRRIIVGEKVNLSEIQRTKGYTPKSAHAFKAISTKTYQNEMSGFIEYLQDEIGRIQLEMSSKDLTKEKYKDLAEVLNICNKQLLLAKGEPTDITKNTEVTSLREDINKLIESVKANGQ